MVGLWCARDCCDSPQSLVSAKGPAIRLAAQVSGYVVARAADRRGRPEVVGNMLVDGREVTVSGSLLQPLTRRTNDILRVALSGALLAAVITSSLVTRTRWDELEKSISRIIGVLTPTQSDVVYLVYGLAVLALPFMILFGLILARQWRLLIPYAAAAFIAVLALSITGTASPRPQWHFDLSDRLRTVLSQFLDDPRWIGMLAAVLTVSGPWLPARWRHWWWTLLLAFIPIHLVVSAIVPARSLLGLAVGWFVGALVILVSGTPALEVPLDGAVRAMAKRGFVGDRADGGPPRRIRAADSCGGHRGSRRERRGRDVRTASTQRRRPAAGCGGSCGCARTRPLPCRRRCVAPSSIAR